MTRCIVNCFVVMALAVTVAEAIEALKSGTISEPAVAAQLVEHATIVIGASSLSILLRAARDVSMIRRWLERDGQGLAR